MNLHSIVITASPTDSNTPATYRWDFGDPLVDLQLCIDTLQTWLNERDAATKAASATKTIET